MYSRLCLPFLVSTAGGGVDLNSKRCLHREREREIERESNKAVMADGSLQFYSPFSCTLNSLLHVESKEGKLISRGRRGGPCNC